MTRACRARPPRQADYDRRRAYHMALYRREASLLRRVAVVRRASCGSHTKPAAACEARACAPALSVSREEANHSSFLRARAALRWLRSA